MNPAFDIRQGPSAKLNERSAIAGLDANEVLHSSSARASIEKRETADMDADEAVVYSSKEPNVWEKRSTDGMDADEAVVYSASDPNVWE